ncbi:MULTISPECIES: SDR family NAD(P)-dependent oxidoreductase [Bacillaceae]|uniref:SDR family NAD(P)-dependent oxidoreductase n=1 Tax=Bacillaceae TaxID=186817 RepID=UPI0011A03688|nr:MULTISPECIES: SDR family oxidoreductase [Bacillaceae]MBU8789256.1 SDR family oxidoreductase [Oceanobacillus caeni]
MKRFENAIALITGAGSGIGEATAKRLASEGARVILVGRTVSKLEKVASEINNSRNSQVAFPFACDVTSEKEVENLTDYVEKEFGDVTVLVNNAGGLFNSTIQQTSYEDWEEIQRLNLNSVFLVSKRIGKVMMDSSSKNPNVDRSIINVASLSGHKPGALFPHYSAAKASVINLTKAMAFEYSRNGIRVNSVSPGFVETSLVDAENEKLLKIVKKKTTMNRIGQPEEIANVIAFLSSKEASYVTGTDMLVDGGFMLT